MTDDERKKRIREAKRRYRQTHAAQCAAYQKARRAARKPEPAPRPATKVCGHCQVDTPLEAFPKVGRVTGQCPSRGAFGVGRICNACQSHLRKPTLIAERAEAARLHAAHLKPCNVCRLIKPWSEFPTRRASRADGLSSTCRVCAIARSARWKKAHPKAFAEYYREHADSLRGRAAEWRRKNPEWHKANFKRWAQANPHKINALIAKRNAAKLRATPAWADLSAIEAIYAEATRITRETGIRHEVDHIYPLQGKDVCGLHVAANLRVITKTENIRKHNRMPRHDATNPAANALR